MYDRYARRILNMWTIFMRRRFIQINNKKIASNLMVSVYSTEEHYKNGFCFVVELNENGEGNKINCVYECTVY